jgi:hypothetical protein
MWKISFARFQGGRVKFQMKLITSFDLFVYQALIHKKWEMLSSLQRRLYINLPRNPVRGEIQAKL